MSLRFLAQFLRHPLTTGAIAPSSRGLARAMVSDMGLPEASVVAEYGPGTGAFTGEILGQLAPGALFFAIERNETLLTAFRRRFPAVRSFHDSVANVASVLRGLGAEHVDAVICGLPWASFGNDLQENLLEATVSVLREGGRFATFAYLQGLLLPSGQAFKRRLHRHFAQVTTSRTVWRNLPPAFVYRCVK
jgi:phospholipid N-methyltransferase